MAKEQNNTPEKKTTKKHSKFVQGLVSLPKRMWTSIQNTIAELKKVTWPSKKDLINSTLIVLAFIVVMAVIIGVLDIGATELISLIIG